LTENVAFLTDFDPNLMVFDMDGWPYAVVDNSQKPGTGNRERRTGNLGTPIRGERRERGTGNRKRPGIGIRDSGTGNSPQKGVRNLFSASAVVSRVYEIP
jgi:hypothetical protein